MMHQPGIRRMWVHAGDYYAMSLNRAVNRIMAEAPKR
jgi:hypothetical protein